MSLRNIFQSSRFAISLAIAAVFAAALAFNAVLADSGPVLTNVNPQGTVTSGTPKITLDTQDLARCKYSKTDTGYDSMGEDMESPDGLYHSAILGSLNKGDYTYYVRCKDFEGNANGTSTKVSFKVGDITCVGENCPTVTPTTGTPAKITGLSPTGTVSNSYVTLSLTTSETADCRYSWYDKSFDSMTLSLASTNRLNHTAPATLSSSGYYTYYVRCRNAAGAVNAAAAKITFRYVPPYKPPVTVTPTDKSAPLISSLAPSGTVEKAEVTISAATDESATCKYGTADASYDALDGTLDAGTGGTSHSKVITLPAAGSYNYFIRCKDKAGNKNTGSSQIVFNYVVAVKEGPAISNLQPTGAIYQKNVALIVQTDKPADCRYSETDVDFDLMQGNFNTNDGLLQQAMVSLESYGPRAYYVRCKDKEGNKDTRSEVINFEYKNPDSESGDNQNDNPDNVTAPPATPVSCAETKISDKDGVCDNTADCLCDADCPASGDDADTEDCSHVVVPSGGGSGWIVFVLIGLVLVVIAVIVFMIIKNRQGEEEDVELP